MRAKLVMLHLDLILLLLIKNTVFERSIVKDTYL